VTTRTRADLPVTLGREFHRGNHITIAFGQNDGVGEAVGLARIPGCRLTQRLIARFTPERDAARQRIGCGGMANSRRRTLRLSEALARSSCCQRTGARQRVEELATCDHDYPRAGERIQVALIETGSSMNDITTMRNRLTLAGLAVMFGICAIASAQAPPPAPGRGALLFQTCSACHNVLGDGIGPDLTGIYGQKAAGRPNFSYSEALRNSNLVWDEATLRTFIRDPQALVKGTKMVFPGYSDDADVEAVIDYLKTYR